MSDEARIEQLMNSGRLTMEDGEKFIASGGGGSPPAQPPAPGAPEFRASWILWPLLSHGILFAAVLVALTVAAPKFEEIFKSFGANLPWLTKLAFGLSGVAKTWGVLLAPAFVAGDLVAYVILRRRGSRAPARLWWWAVSLALIAVVTVIILGLFLPLVHLMTEAGNQAGGPG